MKTKEIFDLWDVDCKIDITDLALESLKIPQLHNKYYKIYMNEKAILRNLLKEHAALKHNKEEFYTLGPTEETKALGWQLPPRGKIIKTEVKSYLEVDKDLVQSALKIGMQEEKISLIKSIMETISNRSFQISSAIKFLGFQNGVNNL